LVETTEAKVTAVFAVIAPPFGVTVTACAVAVKAWDVFTAEFVPPVPPHPIALRLADFVTEGLLDPSYLSPVVQVAPSAAQTGAVPVKV
jgi:hypothetical protein